MCILSARARRGPDADISLEEMAEACQAWTLSAYTQGVIEKNLSIIETAVAEGSETIELVGVNRAPRIPYEIVWRLTRNDISAAKRIKLVGVVDLPAWLWLMSESITEICIESRYTWFSIPPQLMYAPALKSLSVECAGFDNNTGMQWDLIDCGPPQKGVFHDFQSLSISIFDGMNFGMPIIPAINLGRYKQFSLHAKKVGNPD